MQGHQTAPHHRPQRRHSSPRCQTAAAASLCLLLLLSLLAGWPTPSQRSLCQSSAALLLAWGALWGSWGSQHQRPSNQAYHQRYSLEVRLQPNRYSSEVRLQPNSVSSMQVLVITSKYDGDHAGDQSVMRCLAMSTTQSCAGVACCSHYCGTWQRRPEQGVITNVTM